MAALRLLREAAFHCGSSFSRLLKSPALVCPPVRDRVRTKMERDILADVNHPFVVKLHYGESSLPSPAWEDGILTVIASNSRKCPL